MSRTLLLVESVAKARKIQGYLGRDYRVQASIGHICDLPRKEYGVDLDTFEETYEVRNKDVVGKLKKLMGQADRVVLATDPDREGEAIAWHLARELGLGGASANRVEFREVTKSAVKQAVQNPRSIDMGRVDAQRARRVLDRIVGFDVSKEICWPAGAQSAGRVQTPALHILCEREREILDFDPETYWTLSVDYEEGLSAVVPQGFEPGEDAEQGADEDEEESSGKIHARKFFDKAVADRVLAESKKHDHVVRASDRERRKRYSGTPYTTSRMQQDASRKLKLSAKQAMNLAQTLFDNGFITYHRTDSTRVSDDAVTMARDHIKKVKPSILPKNPPAQHVGKGAQDAHEAIRPTQLENEGKLPKGTKPLYEMIKARFLAAQSIPAEFDRTTIRIESGPVEWVAQGSVLVEEGFLYFWRPYARINDEQLPDMQAGQTLSPDSYEAEEKKTKPPSRYDTGSLIRKLETSGVGRPSTFASIIDTLLRREYAEEVKVSRKEVIRPTEFGLKVDALLSTSFPELASPDYTASMEDSLDRIEAGDDLTRTDFLQSWYEAFRENMESALPRAKAYREKHGLKPEPRAGSYEETDVVCDRCGDDTYRKVKRKKDKGEFFACPACRFTRDLDARVREGDCPKCGSALVERTSRKGTKFFGCVRYGLDEDPCDHIESAAETTDETCDRCAQAPYRKVQRASGKKDFLACSACGFTRDVDASVKPDGCPECGSALVERRTKKGSTFMGCVRYGMDSDPCDYTESMDGPRKQKYTRHDTGKTCPKCEEANLILLRPTSEDVGSPFYGCDDRCGFTMDHGARVRSDNCPDCGAYVIERTNRDGDPFWSCAKYPDCTYAADVEGAETA